MNATPNRPAAGLWMAATCPTCGGPIHIVNPGGTNGRETKAIVRCENKHHGEWVITCRLEQVARTGTRAA